MIRLHVNIDHVATLRNQRDTSYPDIVQAAELCLEAGAQGITVHLREDRRHIRDGDVERLRAVLGPNGSAGRADSILNLEMAATDEMCGIVRRIRPDMVTLVPEKRNERTTEGGLDAIATRGAIERVAAACAEVQARLSLFIEADPAQIRVAPELGAVQVELHTGHYAEAAPPERPRFLERFVACAELSHELGLHLAAGHGLNIENVGPIVAIPHMAELNIGHSVVCDAVMKGLGQAVRDLLLAMKL